MIAICNAQNWLISHFVQHYRLNYFIYLTMYMIFRKTQTADPNAVLALSESDLKRNGREEIAKIFKNVKVPTDEDEFRKKQRKKIAKTLYQTKERDLSEILSNIEGINLVSDDFDTLKPKTWLNDQIMNAYLHLLRKEDPKVLIMDTFFVNSLLRGFQNIRNWTNDVFAYDLILVPIHWRGHWCLMVVDFPNKKIKQYYSKNSDRLKYSQLIMAWLSLEKRYKQSPNSIKLNLEEFTLERLQTGIPCQSRTNKDDCGVFCLAYARSLVLKRPMNFGQKNMLYFRYKFALKMLSFKGNAEVSTNDATIDEQKKSEEDEDYVKKTSDQTNDGLGERSKPVIDQNNKDDTEDQKSIRYDANDQTLRRGNSR